MIEYILYIGKKKHIRKKKAIMIAKAVRLTYCFLFAHEHGTMPLLIGYAIISCRNKESLREGRK